jgi:LysR family glycine cleavage system transcriptional activator
LVKLRSMLTSLNGLVLFEASARLLSFSRAASELGLTQSAVSHAIKQLETTLLVELFSRSHRALSLTPEGERLYLVVTDSLGAIAETIEHISGRVAAGEELSIAVSTSFATHWLLPRVAGFRSAFPDVRLRIQTVDRDVELQWEHIDLAIRLGDGHWPEYDRVKLWPETLYAVCSPGYLAAHGTAATLDDLSRRLLIHYEDHFRHRMDWWEWFAGQGFKPARLDRPLRLTDYAVTLQAAMDGQGIAIGWRPIIDDMVADGRLVLAYPAPVATERHFYIVTQKKASGRKPLSLFCDWLAKQAMAAPAIEAFGGGSGD